MKPEDLDGCYAFHDSRGLLIATVLAGVIELLTTKIVLKNGMRKGN